MGDFRREFSKPEKIRAFPCEFSGLFPIKLVALSSSRTAKQLNCRAFERRLSLDFFFLFLFYFLQSRESSKPSTSRVAFLSVFLVFLRHRQTKPTCWRKCRLTKKKRNLDSKKNSRNFLCSLDIFIYGTRYFINQTPFSHLFIANFLSYCRTSLEHKRSFLITFLFFVNEVMRVKKLSTKNSFQPLFFCKKKMTNGKLNNFK